MYGEREFISFWTQKFTCIIKYHSYFCLVIYIFALVRIRFSVIYITRYFEKQTSIKKVYKLLWNIDKICFELKLAHNSCGWNDRAIIKRKREKKGGGGERGREKERESRAVSCTKSQTTCFRANSGLLQLRKAHSAEKCYPYFARRLSPYLLSSLLLGCQIFHREQVISEFLFSSGLHCDGGAITLK